MNKPMKKAMNKAILYNIVYQTLICIYNNTYTEDKFIEIVKKESQNKIDNIILGETTFIYNTLKNFPWYTILNLINIFKQEMQKESQKEQVRHIKELSIAIIEDLDFVLKERLKTIFYQNVEILFRKYYSLGEKMAIDEATQYLSQNYSNVESLVSLTLAENTEYEKEQNCFAKIKKESEEETRENISKLNDKKKRRIEKHTINLLKSYLNDDNLNHFLDLIDKCLEKIATSYDGFLKNGNDFYQEILQKIYKNVVEEWLDIDKKQAQMPLLKMLKE